MIPTPAALQETSTYIRGDVPQRDDAVRGGQVQEVQLRGAKGALAPEHLSAKTITHGAARLQPQGSAQRRAGMLGTPHQEENAVRIAS